jgi:hypothetical protein
MNMSWWGPNAENLDISRWGNSRFREWNADSFLLTVGQLTNLIIRDVIAVHQPRTHFTGRQFANVQPAPIAEITGNSQSIQQKGGHRVTTNLDGVFKDVHHFEAGMILFSDSQCAE